VRSPPAVLLILVARRGKVVGSIYPGRDRCVPMQGDAVRGRLRFVGGALAVERRDSCFSFPFPTRTRICRGDSGCAQETKTASAASLASREARGRQERERLALIIGPEATEQTNRPCRRFTDKNYAKTQKQSVDHHGLQRGVLGALGRLPGPSALVLPIRRQQQGISAHQDARCQMQKGPKGNPKGTRQLVAGAGRRSRSIRRSISRSGSSRSSRSRSRSRQQKCERRA